MRTASFFSRNSFRVDREHLPVIARAGVLVFGAILISAIPLDTLAAAPEICVWKRAFGFECWGCGMTRALASLARGEFSQAFAFNWRVVIVAPLLLLVSARWVRGRQS